MAGFLFVVYLIYDDLAELEEEYSMIEYLGLIYTFGKDLLKFQEWNEEVKTVDLQWLKVSGLEEFAAKNDIVLVWAGARREETLLLKGYEVFYEIDEEQRVKRKIVINDSKGNIELVLMSKPHN